MRAKKRAARSLSRAGTMVWSSSMALKPLKETSRKLQDLAPLPTVTLEGGSRYALLGISNGVMVAEITANRVLDQIDPPE